MHGACHHLPTFMAWFICTVTNFRGGISAKKKLREAKYQQLILNVWKLQVCVYMFNVSGILVGIKIFTNTLEHRSAHFVMRVGSF
jgi:hypothetical protein